MKLLVTGGAGMVGSYVTDVFTDDEVVLTDIVGGVRPLDVRDVAAVRATVDHIRPDGVLHLAAATDVDRCEQEPDWAHRSNAAATEHVVEACRSAAVPLVYVSTGAVFAGDKPEPYTELDEPRPSNVYAASKLAGERAVAAGLRRYFIVRAGWMFGGGVARDSKFVGKITRLILAGGQRLEAVDDKIGSPTYARDLLATIRVLLRTEAYGVYHAANPGACTRYRLATFIRDILRRPDIEIAPVSSERFPLPAPRGRSEALASVRLAGAGITMRGWQEALREYVTSELAASLGAPPSTR
jgi:dTDP-4-dehydrorhamnose reductase